MRSEHFHKAIKAVQAVNGRRTSRGERVLGALFPARGTGWPGGWSQDRLEAVLHYKNWTYVAVHTICSKMASVMPNMAYVVDAPTPGHTVKVCDRGFLNLMGRGFGGDPMINTNMRRGEDNGSGSLYHYHKGQWESRDRHIGWDGASLMGESPHSFMTMGEYRSKALSVVKPHEELEPLENYHPLRRLFENPNPFDTAYNFLYELQMFEELTGVSYIWVVPNDFGMPCEMWVIPSHWVWPRTGGGRYVPPDNPFADRLIQYYEVRPWGGMGSAGILKFPPDQIIMNLWKSPLNKIDGYSKLSAVAQWIEDRKSVV